MGPDTCTLSQQSLLRTLSVYSPRTTMSMIVPCDYFPSRPSTLSPMTSSYGLSVGCASELGYEAQWFVCDIKYSSWAVCTVTSDWSEGMCTTEECLVFDSSWELLRRFSEVCALVEIAMITLFPSQMAKPENSMSTCFGNMSVARKRRKLTCEVQSIANPAQGPGRQNPMDKNTRTKRSVIVGGQGSERDAHPSGSDPSLSAGQCE
jgi:hypothetical protein